jgi:hypothetical protein
VKLEVVSKQLENYFKQGEKIFIGFKALQF